MTRPAEVRVAEDALRGTRFADYEVGARTGTLLFTLEPAFIDEFIEASGVDAALYRVGGRDAAPPQVLTLFLMATLHQRYAPLPATVMAGLDMEFHAPLWRDEATALVSEGEVLAKDTRRGRHFVTWRADFRRATGEPVARIANTFVAPA